MRLIFGIVCLIVPCLAAAPPTTVGPHHIGETLAEWISSSPACISYNPIDYGKDGPYCERVNEVTRAGSGYIMHQNSHGVYTWTFTDRLLSELSVIPNATESIQVELGLLIQKYGKPTKNEVITHENLYGAKWEGLNASWQMPDGTLITAGDIRNDYGNQQLVIIFKSAAVVEKELRERQNKPNPY
jgi:hypothetical protein